MNNVNLVGRFVRDLDLKYSKEGKEITIEIDGGI